MRPKSWNLIFRKSQPGIKLKVKSIRLLDGNIALGYSSVWRTNSAIPFQGYSSVVKEIAYSLNRGDFTKLFPQVKPSFIGTLNKKSYNDHTKWSQWVTLDQIWRSYIFRSQMALQSVIKIYHTLSISIWVVDRDKPRLASPLYSRRTMTNIMGR
jgi:hypothetical protein